MYRVVSLKGIALGKHVISVSLIVVVLVSGITGGALGLYMLYKIFTISVEVKEPIEVLHYPSSLSLYPGETEEFNITVQNHASVNYSALLVFQLDNITYQDEYVAFSNETYLVTPGQQNLNASFTTSLDAPPTNASLYVNLYRLNETEYWHTVSYVENLWEVDTSLTQSDLIEVVVVPGYNWTKGYFDVADDGTDMAVLWVYINMTSVELQANTTQFIVELRLVALSQFQPPSELAIWRISAPIVGSIDVSPFKNAQGGLNAVGGMAVSNGTYNIRVWTFPNRAVPPSSIEVRKIH